MGEARSVNLTIEACIANERRATNGSPDPRAFTSELPNIRCAGIKKPANDPRLLFGLGQASGSGQLAIRWPDGSREQQAAPASGAYVTLGQGGGRGMEVNDGKP